MNLENWKISEMNESEMKRVNGGATGGGVFGPGGPGGHTVIDENENHGGSLYGNNSSSAMIWFEISQYL